jgi:hypothetical protein
MLEISCPKKTFGGDSGWAAQDRKNSVTFCPQIRYRFERPWQIQLAVPFEQEFIPMNIYIDILSKAFSLKS